MMLLGFDIGGTKCAVIIGREENDSIAILDKRVLPTEPAAPAADTMNILCDAAKELLQGEAPSAIGVSCGGPLSSKRGVVISPPHLPGWHGFAVGKFLEDRFGAPVYLENDANACALAEWKFGAGRGCEHMAFFTFGTGLGAGLILNGRLYRGANDMAGEAGHMRLAGFGPSGYGKMGSFEGFCSGQGLAQLGRTLALEAQQRGETVSFDLDTVSAKTLAIAADNGDPVAKRTFEICGEQLGRGLAALIDILNPERIVLGSVFARSEHLLRPAMERTLAEEALPLSLSVCRILPAQLGEQIGDYAALTLAAEKGGTCS